MRIRSTSSFPLRYMHVKSFNRIDSEVEFRAAADPASASLGRSLEYLHYHSFAEIGYCSGGTGVCRAEDVEQPFRAGDAQFLPPYRRHINVASGDAPAMWRWIYVDVPDVLAEAGFSAPGNSALANLSDPAVCGILSADDDPESCALVRRLIDEAYSRNRHRIPMCAALLIELLITLQNRYGDCEQRRGTMDVSISPALVHIAAEIAAGRLPSVTELAGICSMSLSTFRRAFSKEVGMPPSEYVRRFAVDKAQGLLAYTDLSVTRICAEAGFEDASGFNRCFRQYSGGLSPTEYRRTTAAARNRGSMLYK